MSVETISTCCPVCGPGARRSVCAEGIDFEYAVTGSQRFSMSRCDDCGTRFLDPRPIDVAIASLYPPEYEPYRFDELPRPIRRARELVQSRKARRVKTLAGPGARILDLGCGGGALLRLLRKAEATWRLVGWDFEGPHLVRLAAEGFEVIAAPIVAGFRPSGTFDLVILNQTIEHLPDPAQTVEWVATMLAPGGRILIETPDVDGLDARLFAGRYWGGYHFPRHLVLFNRNSLARLLELHGLSVESIESLASPAFWVQSLHHCLSERQHLSPLARFFTLRNPLPVAAATLFDLVVGRFVATSNMRVVARKVSP